MHIELIDLLRCPREHEETWLVAAFTRMKERFVIEGKLGCPVCTSSYAIIAGVADLRLDQKESVYSNTSYHIDSASFDDEVMRAAALLGLIRPGWTVAVEGVPLSFASKLSRLAQARVVSVNPASGNAEDDEGVAVVLSDYRFPLGTGSIDGAFLANPTATAIRECHRILRPGGRLVVPATTQLDDSFKELARDERSIVAEAPGSFVTLSAAAQRPSSTPQAAPSYNVSITDL